LLALAERARKATGGLIRHLRSTEAPGDYRQRPPRSRGPRQRGNGTSKAPRPRR
jgi:hypothetical protein